MEDADVLPEAPAKAVTTEIDPPNLDGSSHPETATPLEAAQHIGAAAES